MKPTRTPELEVSLHRLVDGFWQNGADVVHAVYCCDRLYVGVEPASQCSTCQHVPTNVQLRRGEDVSGFFAP